MALVPFGPIEPDSAAMASAGAEEAAGISRDLAVLSTRIKRFFHAHPRDRCKCPFCAAHPHAVECLNIIFVSVEMHADFLDNCRPPTAEEFRDFHAAVADVPLVTVAERK